MRRRHDELAQVLAELARSCGHSVEVEPSFSVKRDVISYDLVTGQRSATVRPTLEHGERCWRAAARA